MVPTSAFENTLAEFLDSIRPHSILWLRRSGLRNDPEDCVQDASVLFEKSLRRKEAITPGIDVRAYEGLWWRILRQRLVHSIKLINSRREQPCITIDEDGKEQDCDYLLGRERERPQEQTLILKANERILAEFLRHGVTKRGGKAVRALLIIAAAEGADSAAEAVIFMESYMFHKSPEWEERRRDLTLRIAQAVGCSCQALYASLNRVKQWWYGLKSEVLNSPIQ